MATGKVPLLDETGKFPDRYAPPSVAVDAATASTARTEAQAARDAAVVAKNAAEAVPVTNDGIMAAVAGNPDSAFATQQRVENVEIARVTVQTRASAIGTSMSRPTVPHVHEGVVVAGISGTTMPSIVAPAILDMQGVMENPLARYYIFTSPDHAGSTTSGIHLWTTDDLTGTWTYRGRILDSTGNQIEFPSVVYSPDTGLIYLYAQAYGGLIGTTGQLNFVWTATPAEIEADPTDWTLSPAASHRAPLGNHQVDAVSESHDGYQWVVLINSTFVSRGLSSGGALGRNSTWYSDDGLRFWPDLMPNAGDLDIAPAGERDHLSRFVVWQGQIWGLGSRRINQGGGGGIVGVAIMGLVRDDLSGWGGRPTILTTTAGDPLPNASLFVTAEGQALFFSTDYSQIRCYEVAAA